MIHVALHPVELMLNAEKEIMLLLVLVCLVFLEIHILNVNLSAPPTLSALITGHVFKISVWIHAQEYVELMHTAESAITIRAVFAILVILEIHLDHVD